jgi:hypothetical protein
LFNILEEILRILIEREPTYWHQRIVLLWPDFSGVENIPSIGLRLLRIHDLQVHRPRREIALLNGVEHVLDVVVWLFACQSCGIFFCKVLNSSIRLEVDLYVFKRSVVRLAELERVHTEAVDVAERSRNAALTEELHKAMYAFLVVVVEVPVHGCIWHVALRMTLVAPVQGGELDGIADEKHRQVVTNDIIVSFVRVKLHGPSSNVANRVWKALFPSGGAYPHQDLSLFTHLREDIS